MFLSKEIKFVKVLFIFEKEGKHVFLPLDSDMKTQSAKRNKDVENVYVECWKCWNHQLKLIDSKCWLAAKPDKHMFAFCNFMPHLLWSTHKNSNTWFFPLTQDSCNQIRTLNHLCQSRDRGDKIKVTRLSRPNINRSSYDMFVNLTQQIAPEMNHRTTGQNSVS